MSQIVKTKIVLTVLHDRSTCDYGVEDFDDLRDVLQEMDDGEFIGTYEVVSVEDVEADKVKDELRAIGDDGTFFEEES